MKPPEKIDVESSVLLPNYISFNEDPEAIKNYVADEKCRRDGWNMCIDKLCEWIDEAPIEEEIQKDLDKGVLTNKEIKLRLAQAIRKLLKGEKELIKPKTLREKLQAKYDATIHYGRDYMVDNFMEVFEEYKKEKG